LLAALLLQARMVLPPPRLLLPRPLRPQQQQRLILLRLAQLERHLLL
jgi:hypothetical protein